MGVSLSVFWGFNLICIVHVCVCVYVFPGDHTYFCWFFQLGPHFFFVNVPSLQQNIHIKTLADDMVRWFVFLFVCTRVNFVFAFSFASFLCSCFVVCLFTPSSCPYTMTACAKPNIRNTCRLILCQCLQCLLPIYCALNVNPCALLYVAL